MTDKEKIRDAAEKGWMKWLYDIYKRTYYQRFGYYCGCLSYRDWLSIRIDLYKP